MDGAADVDPPGGPAVHSTATATPSGPATVAADSTSGATIATPMRERLASAALTCIERHGLAKTTLEEVAAEAAVSRQTIYRHFADRHELMAEALIRELEAHAGPDPSDGMALDVTTPQEAVATLVEAAVFTLESIAENPRLSALLATEGDSVRATLAGASRLLFAHHADALRPWLQLGQGAGYLNAELDPDDMAEWLLRITLSLITTDGPTRRAPDELRRYLHTYLTPVLAGPGPAAPDRPADS